MTTVLSCADFGEVLDAYVDGELAQVVSLTEQQVVEHLTQCRSCLEHVMIVRHLKLKLTKFYPERTEPATSQMVARIVQHELGCS